MTQFTVVADYHNLCGECPLWHQEQRALYWTDITGCRFFRYDWDGQRATVLHSGFEVCGFAFNGSAGFVVVNSAGIWVWDLKTKPVHLAADANGIPCQMNDCIADPEGRLIAGSCFYDANRDDYPLGHLMRVDHDGSVQILDEGFRLANGLCFSPDGRTLYFTDSADRLILAYDYDPKSGTVRNRRTFVRVPAGEGLPDGLTVDAEGFVWSAQWFGSCIVRYDPDGKLERRVAVPAKQTSSLGFGGPALMDIFVTSAEHSDSLPLASPDYNPHEGNIGGQLLLGNLGIAGKPEYHCHIRPNRE